MRVGLVSRASGALYSKFTTLGLDDEAIYELDGYMDFEKYGQDCMENDGVTKTEFGLLRRLDPPFPEQTQGQQMFR